MSEAAPLLDVRGLAIVGRRDGRDRPLVTDWSLKLAPGEAVGVVGESGGGKSLACLALADLLPAGTRSMPSSSIVFEGQQMVGAPPERWRALRGRGIAFVFQDAQAALNPLASVGAQLTHTLKVRMGLDRRAARLRAVELLAEVELPDPDRVLRALPDELSGGMAQRVAIALAISMNPKVLVADEPTSALDGPVRVQVLDLLSQLRRLRNMGLLLVSHDLGVVARTCDRIAVQYGGRIVEEGPTGEVFGEPQHPYTRGLLAAQPSVRGGDLPEGIPGAVQELGLGPAGCVFRGRCPQERERCLEAPPLESRDGRRVACWLSIVESHV